MKVVVFRYHDYREYLRELLDSVKSKSSLRKIAANLGMAPSMLSMILNQKRNLSLEQAQKISEYFKLNAEEKSYFEKIMIIADTEDHALRVKTLKELQKFNQYTKLNQNEIEVYKYLNKWYNIAIRELTALPDFQLDAQWIQKKLRFHVSKEEIKKSLVFLIETGLIELDAEGKVKRPDKHLKCMSGIYRLSLAQYYREMFELSAKAFDEVPREERNFASHTIAVPKQEVESLLKLIDEFMAKVHAKTEDKKQADVVYQIGLQAFPISKKPEGS